MIAIVRDCKYLQDFQLWHIYFIAITSQLLISFPVNQLFFKNLDLNFPVYLVNLFVSCCQLSPFGSQTQVFCSDRIVCRSMLLLQTFGFWIFFSKLKNMERIRTKSSFKHCTMKAPSVGKKRELFWPYGFVLVPIFFQNICFCFSRQTTEIFSICLILDFMKPNKILDKQ